jgi:O-antigen ligase
MKLRSLHLALLQLYADGGAGPAERWRLLTACFFAAALPLAPQALPWLMAVMVATQVVHRDAWRTPLLRIDWRAPSPWLLVFFVAHIAGMAWTTNQDFGWFDIGIKLALGVLPVVAFLRGSGRQGRDAVLISLCLGCAVAVLFYLGLAFARMVHADGEGLNEFMSSRFSPGLHPSYLAWYLVSAIVILLTGETRARLPRFWRNSILLILLIGVVLCQGRMGWIALPVVLVWALIQGWRERVLRKDLLMLMLLAVLGGASLVLFSSGVRARILDMATAISAEQQDATQSAAVRTLTWRAACDVGNAHLPLGTGTGDVKDELIKAYDRMGATHASEKRLNAHSQFLQSYAALGLAGVAALLLALLLPFISPSGSRSDRGMLRLLLIVAMLNLAVESMLEVQAGVLFLAFIAWVAWWPGQGSASSRA